MTDEPKTDATGNDAKPIKEKRTNRPKPVMEPETIGVAQLGQMAGDYDRAHPSRNDYYGVPACKWRKDGKPLRFDKSVAKAILTKRDLKAAGEQSDAPVERQQTHCHRVRLPQIYHFGINPVLQCVPDAASHQGSRTLHWTSSTATRKNCVVEAIFTILMTTTKPHPDHHHHRRCRFHQARP